MTLKTPNLLFVYGSLRRNAQNVPEARLLRKRGKFIGAAKFQGKMFLIGQYPGVIDSKEAADTVFGDLYELDETSELLRELDAYEGCGRDDPRPTEFVRAVRTVYCADRTERAYIYLYNWNLVGKRRIRTGDFVSFVRERELVQ